MALENYFEEVAEAASFLKKQIEELPKLVVVLSGGLDAFVKGVQKSQSILSTDIPHFPKAKAEGHKGELIFGLWENLPIVCLKGRFHFYEGLSPQEVVFPYFVLGEMGVQFLVTTNAVGGVRMDLNTGDIMLVTDHINMMGTNPLIGLSVQRSTDQFPSMQEAYDPQLNSITEEVAKANNLELKKGVYLANPGPTYETPAEVKAFRGLGADSVGMSTVFSVIAAKYLKMRTLTLNIITNPSADRHTGQMKHDEVLEAMRKAQDKVVTLLKGVVSAVAKLT